MTAGNRKLLRLFVFVAAIVAALALWHEAKAEPGEELPPRPLRPVFADSFEGEDPRPIGPAPGFRVFEYKWEHVFFGATWPNGISTNVPIGSFTTRDNFSRYGLPIAGKVITTKFVADNRPHRISWVNVQPINQVGYRVPNGAVAMTVTISEHRADMYAPCQFSAASANIFYGPYAAVVECRTVAGRTYWLTVHAAPPDFNPLLNTCDPFNPSRGIRCDANFNAR